MTCSRNSARQLITILWLALVAATLAAPWNVASSQTLDALEDQIDAALRKADQLEKEEKYDESIALMEATVKSARRAFATDHPAVAAAVHGLGVAYAGGMRYDESEACEREALKFARAHPAETGTLRLSALNSLVEVLLKKANYKEALPLCEESVKGVEEALGPDDWRTNVARDTMAKVYLSAKRPADAIPVARVALKYAVARFKADNPETISFRHTLSMALLTDGRYPEAERLFKESLAIAEKRLNPTHELTIATLNGLAAVCQQTDRNEEAAAYLARASGRPVADGGAGDTASRPADDTSDPDIVNNRASMLMLAGQFPEAEREFHRALELKTKRFGPDHPETSKILANFATLYTRWAKFADAERYARKSLAAVTINPGPGTVAEAKGQMTLAMIYLATGRYHDAEPLLKASHTTLNRLDPGHPDTLFALNNLAGVYWATKRYGEAALHCETALAVIRERIPGDSSYAAVLLMNIGQSYLPLGKLDQAEDRLGQAVAMFQKSGRLSADSAAADNALGSLYLLRGKTRKADILYRRSAHTYEQVYGPDHPDTMLALDNLATFLASQSDLGAAADLFDRTRKLRRSFLARTLPALSDDDQFSLIEIGETFSRDGAFSFALQHRTEPGLSARSAEWALNSKAVALRAQAERAVLSRDATNPEAARLLAQLDTIRARLAMADPSLGISSSESNVPGTAYIELVEQEQEISRQLGLALNNPSTDMAWAKLAAVRHALPADAVLVEFLRVRVFEFASEVSKMGWRSPRYAAWVIHPSGSAEVSLIDLGPASVIDAELSAALRTVQVDPCGIKGSRAEPESEREAMAALKRLSDVLLAPLRAQLDPARRWVLSPDSALWLVPWAALPVADGRYAVEDHLIFLTASGHDVLDSTSPATSAKPAILADPDYDLSVDKVMAKAHELSRVRSTTRGVRFSPGRSRALLAPTTVDRLAGFRDEAEAVAPLMKEYSGLDPDVFLDSAASETVFKCLHGPRALLISTHGFFESGPEVTGDAHPLSPGRARRPAAPAGRAASPLLRCGLALAGFNASHGSDGLDDGLLTGLEVVGVDLRGTEIVVLSACETGLGEVRSGEGVAGLRQSFQLAGARGVVASLWKVQDKETYELIAMFFQGMAHRNSSATALRQAQLALIADRRGRIGAAHPYFWAAFSLTGLPGPSWREEALAKPGSVELPPLPRTASEARPDAAVPSNGRPRAPAISPVTGRPESGGPLSDALLAIILLSGGLSAARKWWVYDKKRPS
jgi:CHAT domain-containing protein/tetratricopeptide (TPR) repeat protein